MRKTLISLSGLFFAVMAMMLGNGLLGSLLGLKLVQTSASPLTVGMVMASYYLGLVVGAFVSQGIVRRVGHIRAFAAFGAINVVAVMLLALTTTALAWTLIRIVTGIAMMGLYMVVESWLAERAERSIRGRIFALYMVVTFAGLGGGQFLLAMNNVESPDLFFVAGLLFALCLVPVALTRAVHPAPVQALRFNSRHLFKLAPYAVIGCIGAGLVNGAFYALGPAYAYASRADAAGVGAFMGVTIIGGLLLQWPVGLLSDRFDRRRIMAVLSAVTCALSVLLLLLESWLVLQLFVALLWGGLAFTIYPVAVAHANDHIALTDIVPAAGALILLHAVGAVIGPILAGLLMLVIGHSGLYWFAALISALLVAIVSWHHDRETVSVAEQSPYLPMPRTSQIISQLDPRADSKQATKVSAAARQD